MRPSVTALAEEAHEALGPISKPDSDDTNWALLLLLDGLLAPLQPVEDLVRDQGDRPGYSQALDVDLAPGFLLGWLAQLKGVRLTPGDPTDSVWVEGARDEVRLAAGYRRGTRAAMIAAAQSQLTGTKYVRLLERDTSPYHLTMVVRPNEVPPSDIAVAATNLVTNPSAEVNALNVAGTGYGLGGVSAVTRVTTQQYSGAAAFQVVTPATANAGIVLEAPRSYTSGEAHRYAFWAKCSTGTLAISHFGTGDGGADYGTITAATLTTAWQRFTGEWAPPTAGAGAAICIRQAVASANTFFVDAAQLHTGTTLPTYFDGDTAGCKWLGNPHASQSARVVTTTVRDAALTQKPAGLVLALSISDSPLIDEGTKAIDNVTVATIDNATLANVTV